MSETPMESIYRAYHDKVMGYIRNRVNSRADAEDLCQDVFEKAARKLPEYDPSKAQIGTWLFSITRNTVIDHFRRTRPTEELDEELADDTQVDAGMLRTETLSELAAALKSLPKVLRDIIVLRYYDRKPLTEIASLMGLSYGAVKLRHQQALGLLKEALQPGL